MPHFTIEYSANLDRRVEALIKLTSAEQIIRVNGLFNVAMSDTTSSWSLDGDGLWSRHSTDAAGNKLADIQDLIMDEVSRRRRSVGPR